MAPPGSSAERAYHGGNGKAAGSSSATGGNRTPGTPRKDSVTNLGRERALQDPGLRDYRLGDCIGKGAFGSVYKAFNWGTGEAVAVKQIKLVDVPKSELRMIEAEIDLLKNLHHDNIVKYIGFVKTSDCLNIILEYCENGSLHSICKAYGKFPENLVGVYMTQVLQGLQYLHDQGVIHRDIKGANILTTKDGKVKLADFGVSTSTLAGPDKEAQVVGTPYWMAPEIIQLSGATSASDIWSVGCTVIELLQGKPPYHNLAPMPALFAIVNDDHPPLPEGVSPAARDFLMQCFQKDPNLRVSAKKLQRHPWIVGSRRSDAPVSKAPSNFNEAVEEVKQWNKALKYSENNLRISVGSDGASAPSQGSHGIRGTTADPHRLTVATNIKGPLTLAKPRPLADAFRSPEIPDDDNWDNDFATEISPSALHLPHLKPQDHFGGLLSSDRLKAIASMDETRHSSNNWDDYFDGGEQLVTIKAPRMQFSEPDLQQTLRPTPRKSEQTDRREKKPAAIEAKPQQQGRRRTSKSSVKSPAKPLFPTKFTLPPRPESMFREQSVEDFSDILEDNDHVFDDNVALVPKDSPQLFHPSDLTSMPRSMQPPNGGSLRRAAQARPSVLPDRHMRRTRSSIEIQRFAENESDEDFSDIFGPSDALAQRDESDRGSVCSGAGGGRMFLSKLSNSSWLGDDEEEEDPFAQLEPGWGEMDLEANIARDRHARLSHKVEELVRSLKTTEGEDTLLGVSEELLSLLWENGDVKDLIISAHGLLPILEILEPCTVKSRQNLILQLLKIVNAIILDDVELQENLCFVGGIPIITKFAARQYSNEIRLEAAAFVRQMYQTSTLTLQMFVSAGGLNVLVEFLDEDYDLSRDLVLIGVNGVWNVFELQGPTPKNDFCRIFSRSKILDPLALVLHKVLEEDDKTELSELIEGRIVNIFYLFSQAENYVKEVVAERQVLKTVLRDLRRMSPVHQITMLKFIKNLSMLSLTLESLHSADAIDLLIELLSYSMKKGHKHFREISNQVLNTMFNLCRLSKERQEYAAVSGVIPLLLKIMQTEHPPKEFALPILCDMAHSGSKGRRYLWQNKGLDFYVSLIADQYWQVSALDSISVWLQEETAKVERHLLEGKFTKAITSCFNTTKANSFDHGVLEPLIKILRLSPTLAASLAQAEMYAGLVQKLGHKKAQVRLNLLRLVRNIMDACASEGVSRSMSTASSGRQLAVLFEQIRLLADKDPAVLVRNLASELLRSHLDPDGVTSPIGLTTSASVVGNGPAGIPSAVANSSAGAAAPSWSRSGPRRTSSYTPPGLSCSVSAPPQTPTHHQRPSPSHAYVEVAATPRRSAVMASERENAIYRPRSRDGPGSSATSSSSSSIPRRVSGEGSAIMLGGKNSGGSRLPRTSSAYGRQSISVVPGRSESSSSNKENAHVTQASSGSRYYSPTTTSFDHQYDMERERDRNRDRQRGGDRDERGSAPQQQNKRRNRMTIGSADAKHGAAPAR